VSWYLTIRSDAQYSQFADTAHLVGYLASIPELRQMGPTLFGSATGQPRVLVMMAACSPAGNYSNDGEFIPQVNVVELVCHYDGDPTWYESLASRIASFLGWSAFEDNEDRQIWPQVQIRS
jgi:hypothetical protein